MAEPSPTTPWRIPREEIQKTLDAIQAPPIAILPSPLVRSLWLSRVLNAHVFLKLENLNRGNSFKVRGAASAVTAVNPPPKHVYTASGGNHGVGVASACEAMRIPCTCVLPTSAGKHRHIKIQSYGAESIAHGATFDDASVHAVELANKEEGSIYIHPFADTEVVQGQATIMLELEQQLRTFHHLTKTDVPDLIVGSAGGGGLLAGLSHGLYALGWDQTRLVCSETHGANCISESIRQNRVVELETITSIATTLGARRSRERLVQILRERVSDFIEVSDAEAVQCIFDFLEHEHMLIEPSSSCSLAALLREHESLVTKPKDDRVKPTIVLIVCGSNVTLEEALEWRVRFLDQPST